MDESGFGCAHGCGFMLGPTYVPVCWCSKEKRQTIAEPASDLVRTD